jgi:hypothetical protein
MKRARRLLIVLCVFAVLLGALLAPVSGGSVPGVLVALAPLFGLVVLPVGPADDTTPSYAYVPAAPGPSRAPPVLL